MFVANSCLACLSFTIIMFWVTIIMLHNDLNQISYADSFCIFRGYISYVTASELFYAYFLQAIYSYIKVVYPFRLIWQSVRMQIFLIVITWISPFICILPHVLTHEIRYVKAMRQRITPANTLIRAQRELKMVYRIIILLLILLILGLPITIFVFIGFIGEPSNYHLRKAYTSVGISLIFVIIALFKFTDLVKNSIMKKLKRRSNIVVAIMA
ncbi:unnamed protein product [Adineta steineri]|uniref:G-protein coupled receptors family 1 profile domain-containing protein n=1 Tax=Adineta steineri TaxID=433720 RepID=A0A820B474_9BILA|nr:unnamed protein product [Adineta steineri]